MVLTHDLLEDRCIDNLTIKNNLLFSSYETKNMLQWLCSVIYHTRHQYLVRMSMTHLVLYGVLPFCSCHILMSYLTYKTDNMESIFFIKEGFVDLV